MAVEEGLLLPTSRRKDQWDVFVLLLVLWNCVYIPLQMAFQVRNAVHAGHRWRSGARGGGGEGSRRSINRRR